MSDLPKEMVEAMALRWQKEAEKLMTSVLGKPHRQAAEAIAAALATVFEAGRQDAMKSEIAWEATTPYYKQFITQERYEGFRKYGYHRWYKPYRCSSCSLGERDEALRKIRSVLDQIAKGEETYRYDGDLLIIPRQDSHTLAQDLLREMRDANL